jgi:uncharacterized membrane protein YhaH (DUF805 family)
MFKNMFSFSGRIRRKEWGISLIIYILAFMLTYSLMLWAAQVSLTGMIFCFIAYVPLFWFLWAQAAKRCHDVGKSGWWQLIPFYSLIIVFVEGASGENEFGNDPKDDSVIKTEKNTPKYTTNPNIKGNTSGNCPKCNSASLEKVKYTWWGGVLGPKLLNSTKCNECGYTFNGKTGKSNTVAIIIYSIIIFVVIVGIRIAMN